ADPVFIGLHNMRKAEMSVKVCGKRDPDEGLGVVVVSGGRNRIVEYTELTVEQKNARARNGQLKFNAGSVAIHMFSLGFLRRAASLALPLHAAHKKVPVCDDNGNTIKPDAPNAFKFEKFIFDALPRARRTIILEFLREAEFSPVKNAFGNDSPETARRDMVRKCARWMEQCGIPVPCGKDGNPRYLIEIDPCLAADASELKSKLPVNFKIRGNVLLR
ncbi:MAG: UTP--glucose-1-phosphate uridylyltransferase, partial [bacterium]